MKRSLVVLLSLVSAATLFAGGQSDAKGGAPAAAPAATPAAAPAAKEIKNPDTSYNFV